MTTKLDLRGVTEAELICMMSWFESETELLQWSGPNFRFPFTLETFREDLRLDELESIALVNQDGELVAFGQVYLRVGRGHLGRLVISPRHRGTGVIAKLMESLIEIGCQKFNTSESSLFVLHDNQRAINAYTKIGFEVAKYPEKLPMENVLYMTRNNKKKPKASALG